MNRKLLTIRSIQIYFDDDGAARYHANNRTLESVKEELEVSRDFIEQWLDAAEVPSKPRKRNAEEEAFYRTIKKAARVWQSLAFRHEVIVATLRLLKSSDNKIPSERADAIIEDVITTL